MDVVAVPLLGILIKILDIYIAIVVASVVISWLVAFDVINRNNRIVYMIGDFVYRITEPVLARIRRFMPDLGGLDPSPILLILLCWAVQEMLARLAYRIAG